MLHEFGCAFAAKRYNLRSRERSDVSFKRLCDSSNNYVGCFFKMHDETDEVEKLATRCC